MPVLRPISRYVAAALIAFTGSFLWGAETTVYEFQAAAHPNSSLVDGGDGFFYGTTRDGGIDGKGEVYRVDLATGVRTRIASFTGANGAKPYGNVLATELFLYGTTSEGGMYDAGTIYKIDRASNAFTTITSFDFEHGSYPPAGLTLYGSALFGCTEFGGKYDMGTVFRVDLGTETFTSMGSFDSSNGRQPVSQLVVAGAYLYGTSLNGGSGSIYRVDPATGAITNATTLGPDIGSTPYGDLAASSPYLYGTSAVGGPGFFGTVFRFDPATNAATRIASFSNAGPAQPYGGVVIDGTVLYGTTRAAAYGWGAIYTLELTTGALTVLATFDHDNGAFPVTSPIVNSGRVYGTTQSGGPNGGGTIYGIDPGDGILTTVSLFNDRSTGANPSAALTTDGALIYGVTSSGGDRGRGAIFQIDPFAGDAFSTIASLRSYSQGISPRSAVVPLNGELYSIAYEGGAKSNGTIFRVNRATADVTALLSFDPLINGRLPVSVMSSGSELYVTLSYGPTTAAPVVSFDPASSTLTSFTPPFAGLPYGRLLEHGDVLFGTTASGGMNGGGSIIRIDRASQTAATFTSFIPSAIGNHPRSGLTAFGEFLYGTTALGGSEDKGTIFRMDPLTGDFTTILSFAGDEGASPESELIARGSALYGTTSTGGPQGSGTVFRFDVPTNTLTTLASFGITNGDSPMDGLCAVNSYLYGTTGYGGSGGGGTVFRIPIPPSIVSISPTSGPTAGGQSVTINGTDLDGVTSVTFGGLAANITGNSSSSVTVTTAAHAAGAVDVVVTTGRGTTSAPYTYSSIDVPAHVVAHASSATAVTVSWDGVDAATSYEVVRQSATGTTAFTVGAPTHVYTDTTAAPGTAYLFSVRAIGSDSSSPMSAADLATTVAWTDDPLIAGTTMIKSAHLAEMRTAANAVRALAGLSPVAFTDPSPAGNPVKAVHFVELRSAIDAARSVLGLPPQIYSSSVAPGALVRAADFTEIRLATD